jgi:pyruvate kinase
VGEYPVQAVQMLANIAIDIELDAKFINYPCHNQDKTHALAEALNRIDEILDLQCIVALTETGYSAKVAAAERPRVPIVALTPNIETYHHLNLVWGVRPVLFEYDHPTLEDLIHQILNFLEHKPTIIACDYSQNVKKFGQDFMKIVQEITKH